MLHFRFSCQRPHLKANQHEFSLPCRNQIYQTDKKKTKSSLLMFEKYQFKYAIIKTTVL